MSITPTPACSARARSSRQRSRARAEHGQPRREQPRVHVAVGVDQVRADQPVDGGAERQRQHRGGVGRQAGRQVLVDTITQRSAFCPAIARHGSRAARIQWINPYDVRENGRNDRT